RNKAGCALFAVVTRLLEREDKLSKTHALQEIMSSATRDRTIENGFFSGVVKRYDFTGFVLEHCFLEDVEFRNCLFDTSTAFVDCDMRGTLTFTKCSKVSPRTDDCRMSVSAEYAFSRLRGSKLSNAIASELAEEILERAIRKFRGPFGFHSIMFSTRD